MVYYNNLTTVAFCQLNAYNDLNLVSIYCKLTPTTTKKTAFKEQSFCKYSNANALLKIRVAYAFIDFKIRKYHIKRLVHFTCRQADGFFIRQHNIAGLFIIA